MGSISESTFNSPGTPVRPTNFQLPRASGRNGRVTPSMPTCTPHAGVSAIVEYCVNNELKSPREMRRCPPAASGSARGVPRAAFSARQ